MKLYHNIIKNCSMGACLVIMTVLLSSCEPQKEKSPTEVVVSYLKALRNGDGETIYELTPEDEYKVTEEDKEDFYVWIKDKGPKMMTGFKELKFIDETIEDDEQTAYVKMLIISEVDGVTMEKIENFELVKEDDGWKIILF